MKDPSILRRSVIFLFLMMEMVSGMETLESQLNDLREGVELLTQENIKDKEWITHLEQRVAVLESSCGSSNNHTQQAHVEVESRRFAHAEVAVNVGNARVEVREGEAAELSCTTESEIVFCTFMDPSGKSLNMLPSLNYEDGRISFLGTDPKTQCGVKINNVQEKDNGEWMCSITATTSGGTAKKGTQTATVTVVKPPTSVRIDGEPSGSMELTLPTSNPKEIRCVAEGGRPAPKFSWMLGDKPYNGKVVDEEGAQVLTYIGKPEDNAKTLTCVVEHKGYKEESIANNENKASIALDIRFKPVANQKPEDFYGMQLGQSFDVLMKFKSHPEPTELRWKMHDGTVVAMGSENGRYKASLMQAETPHAGYFSAKLTITTVEEGDQESENSLFVVNELGETEYRFTLGLGEKPAAAGSNLDAGVPSTDEANSGPVIIIVIVALLVVVVVVVAVVARAQGKLCFADKTVGDDVEKSAAQFEALEKAPASPEKELIKEPLTEVKKEPEAVIAPETVPTTTITEGDKEEKRSNGAHTPV